MPSPQECMVRVCKGTKASSNHNGAGSPIRNQPALRPHVHPLARIWLVLAYVQQAANYIPPGCGAHFRETGDKEVGGLHSQIGKQVGSSISSSPLHLASAERGRGEGSCGSSLHAPPHTGTAPCHQPIISHSFSPNRFVGRYSDQKEWGN